MENTFSIKDVPPDKQVHVMVADRGIYTVTLFKDSPFRRLLENQEDFEDAFREAMKHVS